MFEFHCPECNRKIKVKRELAGRKGRCPGCSTNITVPVLQQPETVVALNSLFDELPTGTVSAKVSESKVVPEGIWRCKVGRKSALLLDCSLARSSTFPRVCMLTGESVGRLRNMTIQDQSYRSSGGTGVTTNFEIALPISERGYAQRVRKMHLRRRLWLASGFLILFVGLIAGLIAQFIYAVPSGLILFPLSFGFAFIPLAIGALFPYLKDFYASPDVIVGYKLGSTFTIHEACEEFLRHLPDYAE
jgi:hypothetical protein